jgi:hypothetical protein
MRMGIPYLKRLCYSIIRPQAVGWGFAGRTASRGLDADLCSGPQLS